MTPYFLSDVLAAQELSLAEFRAGAPQGMNFFINML